MVTRVLRDKPRWERDGADWPLRETSRFVPAGGLTWHVQVSGSGPPLLALHGTGAATHSWRALAPVLARDFTVIAPDLPGHGFTETPPPDRLTLPAMAAGVRALMEAMEVAPALVLGHSAGAAILAHAALEGQLGPAGIVSLNGAILPLEGMAGQLFSPIARVLVRSSMAPRFVAWQAQDPAAVRRLLNDTGSTLDARGIELYRRLFRSPGHVGATLAMMAAWELRPLASRLHGLAHPTLLLAAERDRTITPRYAERLAGLIPEARLHRIPDLGHLAHEEDPEAVADPVRAFAHDLGVLPVRRA